MLEAHGEKLNNDFRDALNEGDLARLSDLLEIAPVGNNQKGCNWLVLDESIRNNHFETIDRILQIPAICEIAAEEDNWALRYATRNDHVDTANRLLQIPAVRDNAAARNNKALDNAAYYNRPTIVSQLLEIPAVLEHAAECDNAALHFSVRNGNIAVVNRLLETPDVLAKTSESLLNAALTMATDRDHLETAQKLLEVLKVRDGQHITRIAPPVPQAEPLPIVDPAVPASSSGMPTLAENDTPAREAVEHPSVFRGLFTSFYRRQDELSDGESGPSEPSSSIPREKHVRPA